MHIRQARESGPRPRIRGWKAIPPQSSNPRRPFVRRPKESQKFFELALACVPSRTADAGESNYSLEHIAVANLSDLRRQIRSELQSWNSKGLVDHRGCDKCLRSS